MLPKIIAFGLILMLIASTVVLQMTIFGNYEEMEEVEYEEYQIRINFGKMAEGIRSLFVRNRTASKHPPQTTETPETRSGEDDGKASTVQEAPTVPTVPTIKKYGEGQ